MNNSFFVFPQNVQINPQEYQHSALVLNKKKPEANQEL